MAKNKGYTLIEALIVIAIMAILGGLSMFSIGIIRDAKRSAAVTTFENQISTCLVKTKAVAEVNGEDTVCMLIQKRTSGSKVNYCIKVGYDTSAGVVDITKGTTVDVTDDSTWDAVLPKDVAALLLDGTAIDQQKIKFNKSNGSVSVGAGEYSFVKADGTVYATIYLDQVTGKHHIVN